VRAIREQLARRSKDHASLQVSADVTDATHAMLLGEHTAAIALYERILDELKTQDRDVRYRALVLRTHRSGQTLAVGGAITAERSIGSSSPDRWWRSQPMPGRGHEAPTPRSTGRCARESLTFPALRALVRSSTAAPPLLEPFSGSEALYNSVTHLFTLRCTVSSNPIGRLGHG
jgi:hypothetical protein